MNGKLEPEEGKSLKEIIDSLKSKELIIDSLNEDIIKLINKRQESDFYDYKSQWHESNDKLLHDILCLANNKDNKDRALIGDKSWEDTADKNGTNALKYMGEMGGLDLTGILGGIG